MFRCLADSDVPDDIKLIFISIDKRLSSSRIRSKTFGDSDENLGNLDLRTLRLEERFMVQGGYRCKYACRFDSGFFTLSSSDFTYYDIIDANKLFWDKVVDPVLVKFDRSSLDSGVEDNWLYLTFFSKS